MSNKQDTKGFNRFRDKHPILVNSTLMVLALVALGYIALLFIDVFTSHGQQVLVPDVRNMPLEKAIQILDDAGLKWDISDSTNYEEAYKPGTVIDQDPKAKSYIKKIRMIYLKVNAMHARMVSLPNLIEITSRQGVATLKAMGFKNITVDSIASPFNDLILQVSIDGHNVAPGTSVTVNSNIKLTVGDGSIVDVNPDSVIDDAYIDSIETIRFEEEEEQYEKEMEAEMARAEQERKEQAAQERRERENANHAANADKNKEKSKDNKSKENKVSSSKDKSKDKSSSNKDKSRSADKSAAATNKEKK